LIRSLKVIVPLEVEVEVEAVVVVEVVVVVEERESGVDPAGDLGGGLLELENMAAPG